jgi:hypothetical protein
MAKDRKWSGADFCAVSVVGFRGCSETEAFVEQALKTYEFNRPETTQISTLGVNDGSPTIRNDISRFACRWRRGPAIQS